MNELGGGDEASRREVEVMTAALAILRCGS